MKLSLVEIVLLKRREEEVQRAYMLEGRQNPIRKEYANEEPDPFLLRNKLYKMKKRREAKRGRCL